MMKMSKMILFFFALPLFSVGAGCGVEVGNPTGKKGGSGGKLSIYLADTVGSDMGKPTFYLSGVSTMLVGDQTSDSDLAPVSGAYSGKLDGIELEDGKTFELTKGAEVSPGDYIGLSLDLNQDQPLLIRGTNGTDRPVSFANQERGIFIPQIFTVNEDEDTSITIHLDLRRSLKRKGESIEFGPIGHLIRKEDESSISGKVADRSITVVCAYLKRNSEFNGGQFDRLPKGKKNNEFKSDSQNKKLKLGEGSFRRLKARRPDSLEPNSDEFKFDSTIDCPSAFATAEVVAGSFELSHLWPGRYVLRYFGSDGVIRSDMTVRTEVAPGENLTLP